MQGGARTRQSWADVALATRGRSAWAIIVAAALTALVAAILLAGAGGRPRPAIVEATFEMAVGVRLLGVSAEEAWVATYEGQLRHRNADGWSEPESIGDSDIRGLARLLDGGFHFLVHREVIGN